MKYPQKMINIYHPSRFVNPGQTFLLQELVTGDLNTLIERQNTCRNTVQIITRQFRKISQVILSQILSILPLKLQQRCHDESSGSSPRSLKLLDCPHMQPAPSSQYPPPLNRHCVAVEDPPSGGQVIEVQCPPIRWSRPSTGPSAHASDQHEKYQASSYCRNIPSLNTLCFNKYIIGTEWLHFHPL